MSLRETADFVQCCCGGQNEEKAGSKENITKWLEGARKQRYDSHAETVDDAPLIKKRKIDGSRSRLRATSVACEAGGSGQHPKPLKRASAKVQKTSLIGETDELVLPRKRRKLSKKKFCANLGKVAYGAEKGRRSPKPVKTNRHKPRLSSWPSCLDLTSFARSPTSENLTATLTPIEEASSTALSASSNELSSATNAPLATNDEVNSPTNAPLATSDELISASNAQLATSDEISSATNAQSATSGELNSAANGQSATRDELSSATNAPLATRDEVSSATNAQLATSDELIPANNAQSATKEELSSAAKSPARQNLSSTATAPLATSSELISASNAQLATKEEVSSAAKSSACQNLSSAVKPVPRQELSTAAPPSQQPPGPSHPSVRVGVARLGGQPSMMNTMQSSFSGLMIGDTAALAVRRGRGHGKGFWSLGKQGYPRMRGSGHGRRIF